MNRIGLVVTAFGGVSIIIGFSLLAAIYAFELDGDPELPDTHNVWEGEISTAAEPLGLSDITEVFRIWNLSSSSDHSKVEEYNISVKDNDGNELWRKTSGSFGTSRDGESISFNRLGEFTLNGGEDQSARGFRSHSNI